MAEQGDSLRGDKIVSKMTPFFRVRLVASCLAALGWLADIDASPNALLPRPQEVRYGEGSLAVKGLVIRFAKQPGVEDRFVAEQLADGLSAKEQTPAGIPKMKSNGQAIVLNRTGDGAALPGAND